MALGISNVTPGKTAQDALPYVYSPQDPCPAAQPKAGYGPPNRVPVDNANYPFPLPVTGELLQESSILLTAKKFGLDIKFYYSAKSDNDFEYGRGRSCSLRGYVNSSTTTAKIWLVRGNGVSLLYNKSGTSGNVTTYAADTDNGAISTIAYDSGPGEFTEYMNDGMKLVYKAQVGGGNPVKHEIIRVQDANSVTHTYTYGSSPEAGLLKTVAVPGGRTVTLIYTTGASVSLLNAVQDWSGRRFTFQYNSARYCTTYTTPIGCTTKYGYSLAGSSVTLLQTIEDPRGNLVSYQYDSSRRPTSLAIGSAVWTFTYDDLNFVQSWKSPSGALTTFTWDELTFLIDKRQYPEGYTATYTYSNGMVVKEALPAGAVYTVTYGGAPLWLKSACFDGLGNKATYQYDSYGNLTTHVDGEGNTTTFGYDGSGSTKLRIRMTDALSRITSYAFDGDGQLTKVTDPRGLITTYNFDSYGNVVSMVASDGGITTYNFDSLNPSVPI